MPPVEISDLSRTLICRILKRILPNISMMVQINSFFKAYPFGWYSTPTNNYIKLKGHR